MALANPSAFEISMYSSLLSFIRRTCFPGTTIKNGEEEGVFSFAASKDMSPCKRTDQNIKVHASGSLWLERPETPSEYH